MLVVTHEDFAVLRGSSVVGGGRWEDVAEVRAFKRDELTTDLVCIEVRLATGTSILVHEEMPGWEDFLDVAEVALPYMRARRDWEPQVQQPPFAASVQVLFQRG